MFERAKEWASKLTGRSGERRRAHMLYVAIAEAARRPVFYAELGVPDTPEGRYDLLSLHVILVLRRLKSGGGAHAGFAQLLFDVMFRDVDDTLREMGVGDMRVGKKVRAYAEAFFGRALAYENALSGGESLEEALARNVYGDLEARGAKALAAYVRSAASGLAAQEDEALLLGAVQFPAPQHGG